jgi:hypothetical protein
LFSLLLGGFRLVFRALVGAGESGRAGLECDAGLALCLFFVDFLAWALGLVVLRWPIVTIFTRLTITFEVVLLLIRLLLIWLALIFLLLGALTWLYYFVSPELKLFFLFFLSLHLFLLLFLLLSIVQFCGLITVPYKDSFFLIIVDHRVTLIFAERFRSLIR